MHLLPNDEQNEIVSGVARFMEASLPFERLFGAGGVPPSDIEALWKAAADAGWFGLSLPESGGGVGYSVVEETLVQRELSRNLAPLSLLATPLAAHVALAAGEGDLARELIAGRRRAGFAVRLPEHLLFLDADHCDLALTLKSDRLDLREIGPTARREPASCLDPTLSAVRVRSSGRGVETVAATYDTAIMAQARVLIASHLTAVAERARDMAVEYAKLREQFGRPIGSFQAIKHRCADMAVRCEAAFTQGCVASAGLRDGIADTPLHVASFFVVARDAAVENTRHAAQIHGAIGMTEEHVAHLLIKRTHVLQSLGADRGLLQTLLAA
jgi:alkylation response protein AidB-like acyl-CoA dehydrogenase